MNGPALGTAEANTPLRCIYERRHRISISIGVGDDCMVVITYMLSYSGYLKAGGWDSVDREAHVSRDLDIG